MDEIPEKVPLEHLDIEWVEPRVCAETFENRKALRDGGWQWRPIPPDADTGMPSGLIEVPDPTRQQQTQHVAHMDILVNPKDPWSDFVDVREIPMDATGVPYWIHRRAEKWDAWNESTGKPVPPGTAGKGVVAKKHAGKEPFLPTRCKAIKKDGTRCWGWAAEAATDGHCRAHAPGAALAANMGHNIMLAKVKIMQAMPAMADALEELATSAASEQVRLKAITEMMDRGGVNASTEISIGVTDTDDDPADVVRKRLATLAERLAESEVIKKKLEAQFEPTDVVDAEVIDADAQE